MLSLNFLFAGYNKIGTYEETLTVMSSAGVPGILLPPTIALELIGGLTLVIGFQTRIVAAILASFCVASAFLFYFDPSDHMKLISICKNIAIAGRFVLLTVAPLGKWTLEHKLAG